MRDTLRGTGEGYVQSTRAPVPEEEQGRPWEPFKRITIRAFGNNKTTLVDHSGKEWGRKNVTLGGNCIDPVRGCAGGATNGGRGCPWGCYSKESMKRYHRLFDIPQSMVLKEPLLERDLRSIPEDWVRIGVNGDPCFDWELTCRVCELCDDLNKTPVVLSRFWTLPDDVVLERLKDASVVLHGSLCALDSELRRTMVLSALERYRDLGGKAVLRLVTFAFPKGSSYQKAQDSLTQWGLVLEQPARLMSTNPTFQSVDRTEYRPYRSNITGKPSPRWKWAGQQYPHLDACVTHCWECPNVCMTRRGED